MISDKHEEFCESTSFTSSNVTLLSVVNHARMHDIITRFTINIHKCLLQLAINLPVYANAFENTIWAKSDQQTTPVGLLLFNFFYFCGVITDINA